MGYFVKERISYEEIVSKSRFIAVLIPLQDSFINITDVLNEIKGEYPKAKHYPYAYIFNGIHKSNDDGEPSSCAGRPILEVLKANNINDALLVVIRYFGGIKLGASRLTRTFRNVSENVIKKASKLTKIELITYEILCPFQYSKNFLQYVKSLNPYSLIENYKNELMILVSFQKPINDLLEMYKDKIEIVKQEKSIVYDELK